MDIIIVCKMEEEWRDTDYEKYQIGNFGNCRRKMANGLFRELNGTLTKGYKH